MGHSQRQGGDGAGAGSRRGGDGSVVPAAVNLGPTTTHVGAGPGGGSEGMPRASTGGAGGGADAGGAQGVDRSLAHVREMLWGTEDEPL